MRSFRCGTCGQLVFFDNSTCLRCGSALGYVPETRTVVVCEAEGSSGPDGTSGHGGSGRRCANALVARCNWLLADDDPAQLCLSCRLTTTRPNDDDAEAMAAFADAEAAKRRLLDQLFGLDLPIIDRRTDPERGLAFELLSSRGHEVTTGHQRGVITLDLSESDDAHREFVRQQLGEPYRTVLGHLRHEVGHYFWPLLVQDAGLLDRFRELFGDEQQPYEEALAAHYGRPGDGDWAAAHVSQYASVHPWEDWAETFAHYLHICDGVETAASFGLGVGQPALGVGAQAWQPGPGSHRDGLAVGPMIDQWLGLVVALNAMSRSIGQGDLYPFVLSAAVIEKLEFVHRSIAEATPS